MRMIIALVRKSFALLTLCLLFYLLSCSHTNSAVPPQEENNTQSYIPTENTDGVLAFLDAPLFKEVRPVTEFWGESELNGGFSYQVSFIAADSENARTGLLGTMASVIIVPKNKEPIELNGIITSYTVTDEAVPKKVRVILSSWLVLLSKTAHSRVFVNKTIPQMVAEVLAPYPFATFEMKLKKEYPVEEQFIQYRETDMNFVNRMLEHVGITSSFRDDSSESVMVLTDSVDSFKEKGSIPILETPATTSPNNLALIAKSKKITPTQYLLNGFTGLMTDSSGMVGHAFVADSSFPYELEMTDFPGGYRQSRYAQWYASLRMQEWVSSNQNITGSTRSVDMLKANLFVMDDSNSVPYLVTGRSFGLSGAGERAYDFNCNVVALPSSVPFRPSRKTAWPILGTQTATVLGVEGGRVRVRFHWNDGNPKGGECAAWFRSQSEVKAGEEVVVVFTDGEHYEGIVTGKIRTK